MVSRVLDLKRSTDGTMLFRRPRSWIDLQRAASSVATGPPTDYYLWETEDSIPKVSLFPRPDDVMTLAALVAAIPSAAADTDLIPLSDLLVASVIYRVGAEAVTILSDEARARLGLGVNAAQAWLAEADKSERREAARWARMTRPSHIPAQVP